MQVGIYRPIVANKYIMIYVCCVLFVCYVVYMAYTIL